MYEVKREVTILQVLKESSFVTMNREVYGGSSREIGASKYAESALLANAPFLKAVLPTVLGLDVTGGKWQETVQNYLYGISIDVPKGGKTLSVGFTIDFEDVAKKQAIIALGKARNETFKNEKEVGDYLIGFTGNKPNVPEMELFKYVSFNKPVDYYHYAYCLHHNRVANTSKDVKNSTRIQYYMVTEIDKAAVKRNKYKIDQQIRVVLNKIDDDKAFANAMYSVLSITAGDDLDKAIAFSEMAKLAPSKVITAANDKTLMTKAKVENYIRAGILQRVLGSTMITEANDPSVIIGQNMDTAITYFNNQDNNAKISQYLSAYKALIK